MKAHRTSQVKFNSSSVNVTSTGKLLCPTLQRNILTLCGICICQILSHLKASALVGPATVLAHTMSPCCSMLTATLYVDFTEKTPFWSKCQE
uniref:Uncharacterized protein n=1 Tax=Arundo donax TaxID=35708 RepID=A0A0A9GXY1_ARUDO